MFGLFHCILLLSISLSIAVPLDGTCSGGGAPCDGTGVICRNGTCQCNTPWYTPCNTSCDVHLGFVYEDEECQVSENCVANMRCTDKRCVCVEGYTSQNGLCYKNLNTACGNSSECRSQYCFGSRCTCPSGYEPQADNIDCRRVLVKIYANLNDANQAKALCSDNTTCIDIIASCVGDTENSTAKFCKCPYGYKVSTNNEKCESIESSLFSPLTTSPSAYEECGTCKDDNAVCIRAANQTTCWCRSGYIKVDGKCVRNERRQTLVVFPNSMDTKEHDFTANCAKRVTGSNEIENRLCTCAAGYKFVARDKPCEKIELDWIDDIFEYGLCTRISSRDTAVPAEGLCPSPLHCRARNDKHVCSCGADQFRDVDDPSKCVYFIGKTTSGPTSSCPTKNAERNSTSGICQCVRGYQATNKNRQCEVKLSAEVFLPSCSQDRFNDSICTGLFGKKVLLCSAGECRCSGNESFANEDRTRCYAPVNTTLTSPTENCPPNTILVGNSCNCRAGYRPSSVSRSCVRLQGELIEYAGSPSANANKTWTDQDCETVYTGPVQLYAGSRCQCKTSSFVNSAKDGCWYKLNMPLPNTEAADFCPHLSNGDRTGQCECNTGYTANGNQCVRITNQVYANNDPTALNITGLTTTNCVAWFGTGTAVSNVGGYCICKTAAFRVPTNDNCVFFVNVETTDIKGTANCPANTDVNTSGNGFTCVCKLGYRVNANNRSCEISNILLVGTDIPASGATNCTGYTREDCTVKFGQDAFCRDQKCFCNSRLSFINSDGQCESFSKYIFPAAHELQFYTCTDTKDCDKRANVECGYLEHRSDQKVCKCTEDSYLDAKSETCVKQRCRPECNAAQNFECYGDQCLCKTGYYLSGSVCVAISLQLDQPCNISFTGMLIGSNSNHLECDLRCGRVRCAAGYQPEGTSCVRFQLGEDRCVYREGVCSMIDANSVCNRDENRCSCAPSYYLIEDECAQAVNTRCVTDEGCGNEMICKGQRCRCNEQQRSEEITDIYGRLMLRCVNIKTNGVERIQFHLVMFIVLAYVRVLFV